MTTITTAGTLLAADQASRVLRYLLLPFGVEGNTSAGKVIASAGTINLPADPSALVANDEHDYKRPLGKFTQLQETPAGIEASVRVLPTRAGDDLLLEAAEGVKTGISVEIDRPVIRAGKLLGGDLTGAGFCVRPAFPTAQLVASDMGELAEQAQAVADAAQVVADQAAAAAAEDPETPTEPGEPTVPPVTATRPAAAGPALQASQLQAQPAQPAAAPGAAFHQMVASLGQATVAGGQEQLNAALNPIIQADMFDPATVPAYVGELHLQRSYQQRYAPLVKRGTLTAMTSIGWRFKDGMTPEVFDYAGNLAEVTSKDVELEAVNVTAARLAGGNRLDRIYTDLNDAGATAAYLRESQDDYLKKIDIKTLTHILANTTMTALPTLPAFYEGPVGWAKLLHGARVLLDHALPTCAIVGSDLWFEMGLTTQDQKLEYLSTQLGLEEGQAANFKLVGAPYSATSLNGKVLVGTEGATQLEELPGGPVRVNTVGIQNGAIDHGVFGYYKLWTPDKRYWVDVADTGTVIP